MQNFLSGWETLAGPVQMTDGVQAAHPVCFVTYTRFE
jgi:hypothetical protein